MFHRDEKISAKSIVWSICYTYYNNYWENRKQINCGLIECLMDFLTLDGNDCKFTGDRRYIELKLRNFLAVIPLSWRHRILSSLVNCSDYTLRTILLEMVKLAERTITGDEIKCIAQKFKFDYKVSNILYLWIFQINTLINSFINQLIIHVKIIIWFSKIVIFHFHSHKINTLTIIFYLLC